VETVNIQVIRSSGSEAPGFASPVRRDGRLRHRLSHFLPLAILLSLAATSSVAQQVHPTEFQVKAAYLYNFGKFVTWQDRAANPGSLDICILGKDPFGSILDSTVAGESIDGRKIAVRRLSNTQEMASCSILFVGSSEENRLGPILAAAEHFAVLTVSDIPHFADQGGTIGFVMQQGRIRFEVNRGAAEQSHLILSSELLKVASRVISKLAPQSEP
jgi:hypothetical protein